MMLALKIIPVPFLIGIVSILAGLAYKGIDRKLAARMQSRVGPPLRQPFIDIKKLLLKENIIPSDAISWLFNAAPMVALGVAITILLYLPLGDLPPILSGYGDLILILYLFTLPALALVIGGFASGAPYSAVGAQREMVMMISYELPLVTAVVAIAWKLSTVLPAGTNVFSMGVVFANPLWGLVGPLGFIGFLLLLVVMVLVTPMELSKIPFDIAEAKTEIAGGLLSEYSGRNLAIFHLADAVKMVAVASLIVALFFPYQIGYLLSLSGWIGALVNVMFFLVKLFLVILFSVTMIRVVAARFKIDQVVYGFWVPVTLTALAGLVLIVLDTFI